MSLRFRLLSAILLALVVSFAAGVGLAVWHASRSIAVELAAALDTARRGGVIALRDRATPIESEEDARGLLAPFDGGRHIVARLTGPDGATRASSRLEAGVAPPGWFTRLGDPHLPEATIAAGPYVLRLVADPANEAAERWADLQTHVALLALFSAMAGALCAAIVTVGLRPLTALSHALAGLPTSDAAPRLVEAGPPEIAALATAFNTLADAVAAARTKNARLQGQMARIAEEERAEIARDLHDEFGPLLFGIAAFAATAARLADTSDTPGIRAQLRCIEDATEALQRHVRDMLGRLHDPACELDDIADALSRLTAFWRTVRPDIAFTLELPGEAPALFDAARETLYRGAQEAVSNAVRHGRPRAIHLRLVMQGDAVVLSIADDGQGGEAVPGLGLTGMRARADALGGEVRIARDAGWVVTIRLPLAALADAGE